MIRFSVLMPVYNREDYVRQAVESVLSQTFTDFEFIAIDDGSSDRSLDILKSYGDRIKVIRQPNQGPEVARNTGAAVAQGEYLAFLDSDDYLFPHALATYDRIIRTFNSPPLVMGSEIYFQDGEEIRGEDVPAAPVEVIPFKDYLSRTIWLTSQCSKMVIRRSAFNEVGGHRHSTAQTWHIDDLYILLKLGTFGPCVVVRKPHTFAYRLHEGNSIRGLKNTADGVLRVAHAERQGVFPGGSKRRRDRYAVIGGRAATWAYRYCWRGGERKVALGLLWGTAPMVLAAVWKRFLRSLRKPTEPVVI